MQVINKEKNRLRLIGVKALVVGCLWTLSSSSFAAVWLSADDSRLKSDIALLVDSGVLNMPSLSWPIYSPDVARALSERRFSEMALNSLQRQSLRRVTQRVRAIEVENSILKPQKQLSFEVVSSPKVLQDSERQSLYGSDYALQVSSEQIYKKIAFKVNVLKTPDELQLDNSYLATELGEQVLTLGKQARWWGPSYGTNLLWSSQSSPVFGVHMENQSSEPSEEFWLKPLGPIKLQLFAGQLNGTANPNSPQVSILAGRLDFKPTSNWQVGVSNVQFRNVNLQNAQPITQSVVGIDSRLGLNGFTQPVALYGQFAQDVKSHTSEPNYLLGMSSYAQISSLQMNLQWYLEYVNTEAGLMEENLDDSANAAGYIQNHDSFGANIGSGAQSMTLGALWTHDFGWLLKTQLTYATWHDALQSAEHNALLSRLEVKSQTLNFTSFNTALEYYPSLKWKLEPSIFYQIFDGDLAVKPDNYGLGLKVSYRFD